MIYFYLRRMTGNTKKTEERYHLKKKGIIICIRKSIRIIAGENRYNAQNMLKKGFCKHVEEK